MNSSEVLNRINQLLEQSPVAGFGRDARQLLMTQISQLVQQANLVSRDEFEAQQQLLERTTARLNELQERLQRLEQTTHPE